LGYPTYVLILEETRVTNEKLEPYTKLSILVGYKGNYIYRVYVLSRRYNKIMRSSNCKFDEGGVYTNKYVYLHKGNNKKIKWTLFTKNTCIIRSKGNSNKIKFDSSDFTHLIGESKPYY
jgi:hypothetical protein